METHRNVPRTIALTVVTYGAWLISSAIGVAVLIAWHTALLRFYAVMGYNKYGTAAFNNTVVLLLAMFWLALVIGLEGWYRRSAGQGTLGRAIFRITVGQIALLFLALVVVRL